VEDPQELLAAAAAWLLVAALGFAVLAVWRLCARGAVRGAAWLPLERRRRVSWHGIDVAVCFSLLLFVPQAVHESLQKLGLFTWLYGDADNPAIREREGLWSSAVYAPLLVMLIMLGLHCVRRARLAEFGLTGRRAWHNVALGYLFWLVVTPTALALLIAVEFITPPQFIEPHWLSKTGKTGLGPDEWVVMFLSAAVMAPLLEEILFRGVLLPWQLRRGWEAQATVSFFAVVAASILGFRGEDKAYNVWPVVFVIVMLPGLLWLPSLRRFPRMSAVAATSTWMVAERPTAQQEGVQASPPQPGLDLEESERGRIEGRTLDILRRQRQPHVQAGLAVYTNALLFAALHSVAWPSPIPLFVLGLGLAWLRARTGSLLGCLTVHVLFNAVAVLSLMLEAAQQ
jgi:membrane protease YdiL (CAAX protease family)